jgi:hypothetical protein
MMSSTKDACAEQFLFNILNCLFLYFKNVLEKIIFFCFKLIFFLFLDYFDVLISKKKFKT